MENYYDILGLKNDCSYDDIKSSYYLLCKKYHPDKNGGDDIMFKKISKAYEVLSDERSRGDYDFEIGDGYLPDRVDISNKISLSIDECYHGCFKMVRVNGDVHNVEIPSGVLPGTIIRLKGKGWNCGDLNLIVSVAAGDAWMDDNYNIHVEKHISWYDSLIGVVDKVNVLGEDLDVIIRRCSQDGSKMVIIGKGYPINGRRTSVIVEIKIDYPKTLSEESVELVKRIKEIEGGSC